MLAFILAHGERPSNSLIERMGRRADLFIATDGAANGLAGVVCPPDVILGDFDSLHPEARERYPWAQIVARPDQHASDLEKAILFALESGATEIQIAGATGGRLDHTLANAALLLKYHAAADISLVTDDAQLRVVASEAEFLGEAGDRLSLIAFEPAEGVTAEGLRWPLSDEPLLPGSRGISNVFTADRATVSVRTGALLAIHQRAPDR